MKKMLIALLAVFCLYSFAFAINPNANPNADPDEDWAEKMADRALLNPTPVLQVKGSGIPLVAGDYYIPKGSNALGFDSLHIAVDSINANGVTGTVNLILDADTLREPSFTFNADLSVDNNVVVKPATGRDVCLIVTPGLSQGNGAQMIGFDKGHVTFDGSNNGSTSRNLIVTTETDDARVPFGLNTTNADTVVIKNLIIKNLDNVTTNFKYGAVTNDVGGIQGFTVENCQIGTADRPVWRDGVAVWGDWTNGGVDAFITNNEIHAGARGISTYIFGDCVFSNNTFYLHPSATTYTYGYGIYLSWGPSAEVHNNFVYALEKTTVSGTKIGGIVSASNPENAEFSIVNNMLNIGAADETAPVYGMLFMSSSDARTFNVYHNTIVVNDNVSTVASHGIGNSSTGPLTMDLKNNIVINNHTGNTASSAINIVSTSSVLTSDNNVLVSDQNFVNYQGTSYADLAAWQATTQDANSVSKDVIFNSADDLHLADPSDADLDLVFDKISGIDTDIDGDNRPNPTVAYAGADEGTTYGPNVFFSEYIEGSSNNKALEIYNGLDATVNLDDYRIAQSVNGGGWQYYHYFPQGATLNAGDVWVILNSDASTDYYLPENADEVLSYPSVVHHNGDDARGLEKRLISGTDTTWTLIDIIGVPDVDPGAGWDVAGVTEATKDHTLIRKASVTIGNIDWAASAGTNAGDSEWLVFDQNTFDYLGSHPIRDLNLTFEDDSDVANWGVYDGTSGWTTVAHDPTGGVGGTGAIVFGDGGYGFYIKRPIVATIGTDYQLSIDVKTSGWDDATTYPIALSIEGLEDVPPATSINGLTDFTTITLTGSATNDSGYIVIAGSNTAGHNDVWIDNLIYDDDAVIPDTIAPTLDTVLVISDTTLGVVFSEDIDVTTGETVTNYSIDRGIGNPVSATVLQNTVTLKVSQLTPDSLYTLTVNNVEDLANNPIAANSVITFKYVEYIPVPDLFFSEYIEGTSQNKALEIYNGSGNTVNLSNYVLKGTHNGDNNWDYCSFQFPDIELAAGDVYVLATTDADAAIQAVTDTVLAYDDNKIVYYNGDDARGIFKNGILLDIIGIPDEDPGTAWDVAGVSGATAEHTLVRKAEIVMGNVDWAASAGINADTTEWVVLPQNTFYFLGSHPHDDFEGPELAGVVASGNALVQVRFSEAVDSTIAVDVANYSIDGDIGVPTSVYMYNDDIAILAVAALEVNTPYTLTVNGIKDVIGNTIAANSYFGFELEEPGELPIDITINDFENDIGNWAHPTYSGSTSGILTTSTFQIADTLAYMGAKSGEMILLDDPAVDGGWFVRLWNINRVDKLSADSKLFLYLRGSDADIQIRLVIRDDGSGGDNGYEAGAWHDITVTEDDWQVVSLDLLNDPVTGWVNGNGVITSTNTVSIDCIQLRCSEDISTALYFDMITERPVVTPVDVTFEVNMSYQITLGNFNAGTDSVDVAGSFNDWGGSPIVLDDSDSDSIYSVTVAGFYPGESIEYKFRINGNWDTSEFPFGGPNRVYVVPDTNSVVSHWYNDEEPPEGINNNTAIPDVFSLHQNYPNPFNPTTFIKYDLPKDAKVKIVIYDLMGREVLTLLNEKQNAGYKSILWNGRDNNGRMISSGMYIYQMITDEFQKTKKMTFLK